MLVTCFNKTLVHFLRQKIDDRFGRLAWDRPDEQSLTVTHFEGLVRELEATLPALRSGLDFRQKAKRARAMTETLDRLDPAAREPVLYDAVYVDEAQDLVPEEFELLLRLARKDAQGGQTIVVFYDNAQNIYGVPTPVWNKLGLNIVGRTVYLDQCLRNTRQTLSFAFNVLVGSFAPEGQRVTTRTFADVESLRQRGLVSEQDGRFEIHYSPRTGPYPIARTYPTREAEIDGVVEAVRRLLVSHRVLPSDILILYQNHYPYSDSLGPKLQRVLGPDRRLRFVDSAHNAAKNQPLLEEGTLTVSTIASAKGYDAPVVFLLGVDELSGSTQDRAIFYVGATRSKLHLVVTGVQKKEPTLLDEVVLAAKALAGAVEPSPAPPIREQPTEAERFWLGQAKSGPTTTAVPAKRCRHCQSPRLHAQFGKFGYFYRCIDCTKNTPMDVKCSRCGKAGKIHKARNEFRRECPHCGHAEVCHTNVSLDALFE